MSASDEFSKCTSLKPQQQDPALLTEQAGHPFPHTLAVFPLEQYDGAVWRCFQPKLNRPLSKGVNYYLGHLLQWDLERFIWDKLEIGRATHSYTMMDE